MTTYSLNNGVPSVPFTGYTNTPAMAPRMLMAPAARFTTTALLRATAI